MENQAQEVSAMQDPTSEKFTRPNKKSLTWDQCTFSSILPSLQADVANPSENEETWMYSQQDPHEYNQQTESKILKNLERTENGGAVEKQDIADSAAVNLQGLSISSRESAGSASRVIDSAISSSQDANVLVNGNSTGSASNSHNTVEDSFIDSKLLNESIKTSVSPGQDFIRSRFASKSYGSGAGMGLAIGTNDLETIVEDTMGKGNGNIIGRRRVTLGADLGEMEYAESVAAKLVNDLYPGSGARRSSNSVESAEAALGSMSRDHEGFGWSSGAQSGVTEETEQNDIDMDALRKQVDSWKNFFQHEESELEKETGTKRDRSRRHSTPATHMRIASLVSNEGSNGSKQNPLDSAGEGEPGFEGVEDEALPSPPRIDIKVAGTPIEQPSSDTSIPPAPQVPNVMGYQYPYHYGYNDGNHMLAYQHTVPHGFAPVGQPNQEFGGNQPMQAGQAPTGVQPWNDWGGHMHYPPYQHQYYPPPVVNQHANAVNGMIPPQHHGHNGEVRGYGQNARIHERSQNRHHSRHHGGAHKKGTYNHGRKNGKQGRGSHHSNAHACPSLVELRTTGKQPTMEALLGNVVEYSRNGHGSRFIQFKMETATDAEKQLLVDEILEDTVALANHPFGNYVIQNFLDHATKDQKYSIASTFHGHVVKLSTQAHGCRVIQHALDVLDEPQRNYLMDEIVHNINAVAKNNHGTHVVQKCMNILLQEPRDRMSGDLGEAPSSRQLLETVENAVASEMLKLSVHPHSYRLVQQTIGDCNPSRSAAVAETLRKIESSYYPLAIDQHGNFILQHILDNGSIDQVGDVQNFVCSRVLELSRHKFGSHLVEKCLTSATPSQASAIVDQILKPTGLNRAYIETLKDEDRENPLLALCKDPFANFVVQRAFDASSGPQRSLLADEIKERSDMLSKFPYGRHILSHINR